MRRHNSTSNSVIIKYFEYISIKKTRISVLNFAKNKNVDIEIIFKEPSASHMLTRLAG